MSLARVWNFVPPGKTEYFAAARDWSRKWPHYGFINVGLMLLTPFMHHFDELLKLALMHPYNVYYEQTLISKYFHEDRKDLFFEQPKSLNVMFLSQRNKKEPESVIGYHQEFWDKTKKPGNVNRTSGNIHHFELWAAAMQGLHHHQLSINLHADVIIAPPILLNYTMFRNFLNSSFIFARVVILSPSSTPPQLLANRTEYAMQHARQSKHEVLASFSISAGLARALDLFASNEADVVHLTWEPLRLDTTKAMSLPIHEMVGALLGNLRREMGVVFLSSECFSYKATNPNASARMSVMLHARVASKLAKFLKERTNLNEDLLSYLFSIFAEKRENANFTNTICVKGEF